MAYHAKTSTDTKTDTFRGLGEGVGMRCPFTLYKERTSSGLVWYARFWDAEAKKYSQSRSTGVLVEGKRERRREAEDVARNMFPNIRFTHGKPKTTESFLPGMPRISGHPKVRMSKSAPS
jgi:hypothetical protein